MTNALLKIQAGADKVQAKLASKGFREYTLNLLTPNANDPILGTDGVGIPTPTLVVPSPQIEPVSIRYIASAGGVLKVGDILVTHLTRNVVFESLITDPKTIWRVTGPADCAGDYSVIGGMLKRQNASWRVALRLCI